MEGDYLKKCQPQIAGEDVLWLVSSEPLIDTTQGQLLCGC